MTESQGFRSGARSLGNGPQLGAPPRACALSLGGGKYILSSRMRAGDEVTAQVLTRPGRYQQVADNLEVTEVVVGEG